MTERESPTDAVNEAGEITPAPHQPQDPERIVVSEPAIAEPSAKAAAVDQAAVPTPARRRSRSTLSTGQKALAWVGLIALVAAVSSGIAVLKQTGGNSSNLARLYGLTIADFRAEGKRETRPAPNIVGEDLDGKPLALGTYRGKVIVLNIWGSWCGPCRREEPVLVAVSKEYASRGVQFLGLDVRDQLAAARSFREEFGVTYPSFYDQSAGLTYKLEVAAVPSTFIIDRNQLIFFRFTGAIDRQLLESALDAVLEEAKG